MLRARNVLSFLPSLVRVVSSDFVESVLYLSVVCFVFVVKFPKA